MLRALQALWDEMEPIEAAGGAWGWVQNLYGRVETLIGAGHGFVGNVYPAVRGAAFITPELRDTFAARALAFLQATALRDGGCVNWWPRAPPYSPANKPPQDCHGASGIVCRLAPLPRSVPDVQAWGLLLLQAGELTWRAGPLAKGVAFCHGTAGNAHAFLHLFARTGDERWLARARAFGMHGIVEVALERTTHGQGRHTLWTGDLECSQNACGFSQYLRIDRKAAKEAFIQATGTPAAVRDAGTAAAHRARSGHRARRGEPTRVLEGQASRSHVRAGRLAALGTCPSRSWRRGIWQVDHWWARRTGDPEPSPAQLAASQNAQAPKQHLARPSNPERHASRPGSSVRP